MTLIEIERQSYMAMVQAGLSRADAWDFARADTCLILQRLPDGEREAHLRLADEECDFYGVPRV